MTAMAGQRIPDVAGFAPRVAAGSPKEEGKALRARLPRSAHAAFTAPAGRPDAVRAVEESNAGRVAELTPIRVGRMAANPSRSSAGRPG